jgi:hypothetical protein
MPPNANIFQPGPAMIFLVVDGIPSTGQMIMIGSGKMEKQALLQQTSLPGSTVLVNGGADDTGAGAASGNHSGIAQPSGSSSGKANTAKSTSGATAMRALRMDVMAAVMGVAVACAGAAMF